MPPQPLDIADLRIRLDLAEQRNRFRPEDRLRRICVKYHGLDLNGDNETIGSHQADSTDTLAR